MLLLHSTVLALSSARTPRCTARDLQLAPTSFTAHVLTVLDEKPDVLLDTPELTAAAARMEAVTGIPPVALEELWRAETSRVGPSNTVPRAKTSAMRSWLGRTYERGSDLFVAGKFNILRAHDDLLRPTFAALSDPPSLQDMLFHPCDLQAAAYFPTVLHSVCEAFPFSGSPFQLRRAISPASTQSQSFTFRRISRILGHVDGADYPPRQHLLRYRVWWDDPDHINQLDESLLALRSIS